MRFTDRKTRFTDRIPLLSIRSIRTDGHIAYTVRYGGGVFMLLMTLYGETRSNGFHQTSA